MNVHEVAIRITKVCMVWCKEKELLFKKNTAAHLWFAKVYNQKAAWINLIGLKRPEENSLVSVRSVMLGGRKTLQVYPICEAWSVPAFAASWPGRLVKESVRTSVWERNIKRKREAEQSSDPKHTDGSTKEWLKKNKDVWKWSRQSSDHCSHNTVLQQSLTCIIAAFIFIPVTQSKCIHVVLCEFSINE